MTLVCGQSLGSEAPDVPLSGGDALAAFVSAQLSWPEEKDGELLEAVSMRTLGPLRLLRVVGCGPYFLLV